MDLIPRPSLLAKSGSALVLGIAIITVTYLYVSSESTFYSSDYAGYQNITQGIVAHYRESLRAAIGAIVRSTDTEYNALFTIPLIPFIIFFGESRIVYEISLAVVYLLPFTLVVAAIAAQVIPVQSRSVFWSSIAAVLFMPIAWVPTLRGYPDAGAAFLISVAIWAYLRDTRLNHGWQILLIGLVAALSVLFRRHFAYAAIALFAAMALHTLVRLAGQCQQQPRTSLQDLTTTSLRLGLTAIVTMLVMLVIGRPFLYRGLTTNYIGLYAAYMRPPLGVLEWYAATYGWATLAAAVLGLVIGMRSGVVDREAGGFIAIFGGLSWLEWLFVVRQTGEQYTVHFTPMVAVGFAALLSVVLLRLRGGTRALALTVIILCMAANVVAGLTRVELVNDPTIRALFAMKEPPLRRDDRAEVARLVSYLREVAAHSEPIYVAASSPILTTSLLTTAERVLYGWNGARLNMLYAPQIDSRDAFPLELLLPAKYVVVAHPFQHHMGVEKQRVVKVVYDLFTRSLEIAQDFTRLPTTFMLAEGTVVSVYRRMRPTSLRTAVRTLRFMENDLQTRPGGQLDWMVMSQAYSSSVRRDQDNSYRVMTHLNRHNTPSSISLLYLGALPETIAITGRFAFRDSQCAGATLHLARVDSHGEISDIARASGSKGHSGLYLTFPKEDAINVLLTITTMNEQASANDCSLEIEDLKLLGQ